MRDGGSIFHVNHQSANFFAKKSSSNYFEGQNHRKYATDFMIEDD